MHLSQAKQAEGIGHMEEGAIMRNSKSGAFGHAWVGVWLLAALTFGCESPAPLDVGGSQHGLTRFDSCQELDSFARSAAYERIKTLLETQKQQALECIENRHGGGGEGEGEGEWETSWDTDSSSGWEDGVDDDWIGEGEGEGEGEGMPGDYPGHSDTTEQEQGVREADIVKTDGRHIFFVRGAQLVIVSVSSEGKLAMASSTSLEERPREMFLSGSRLVLFTSPSSWNVPDAILGTSSQYDQRYTRVRILDVEDATDPAVLFDTIYSGDYVSSRMVESTVRLVLRDDPRIFQDFGGLDPWAFCSLPKDVGIAAVEAAYDAALNKAAELYLEVDIAQHLPRSLDMLATGASAEMAVKCADTYGPKTPEGSGLLAVITLDAANVESKARNIGLFAEPGLVYATKEALYVTSSRDYVRQAFELGLWEHEVSGVHKFDIGGDPKSVTYLGSGEVPGRMLNQFCLGEYQGYLRVASTTGNMWAGTSDNHLTVLEEKEGALEVVGQVSGFGQEEEIYGARFMGERGFVVTFRETDPLFTFDLSNPFEPRIMGEWHGPGYSSYMQAVGASGLLAIGQDFGAVVSLYNVGNLSAPTLIERLPIVDHLESSSISSVAVSTHKGLAFDSTTGLLALPYAGWSYGYESEWEDGYYSEKEETGIGLFSVGETKIEPAGHVVLDSYDWQDYSGRDSYAIAQRAVLIGSFVVGMSPCRMVSARLNTLDKSDDLPLFEGSYCHDDGLGTDPGWDTDPGEGPDWPTDWPTDEDTASEQGEDTDSAQDSE
jgi:uncharacterized secreted protein with C-terminal beta-propeller domain